MKYFVNRGKCQEKSTPGKKWLLKPIYGHGESKPRLLNGAEL
jgi:hypothetical protein